MEVVLCASWETWGKAEILKAVRGKSRNWESRKQKLEGQKLKR
jgi:hypothetical protein